MAIDAETEEQSGRDEISFEHAANGTLLIRLGGAWQLRRGMSAAALRVERELSASQQPHRVAFDTAALSAWDSALVAFLARLADQCRERHIELDRGGLPAGVQRLLELAESVPERSADTERPRASLLQRIGAKAIAMGGTAANGLEFVGDVTIALGRLFRGRARYRPVDLLDAVQACGASALGIVLLISYLVGVILAFMGAVQLEQFGATIFVADLVGIGITREMGAMMTAIIMAGRTGAAFAAQIGTMKVRQEVEALTTMGISPVEFLVVPRVLALVIMMPLLCLYADVIGILGGASIGVGMLHLSLSAYLRQTNAALHLSGILGGLIKSVVYGILIAMAGCHQGLRCGNSASAVGDAATAAVVNGIVLVVVACGLFALVFNILGI
jgi:phospholipid/cholesterol/gamma-HCH transport system permease protein